MDVLDDDLGPELEPVSLEHSEDKPVWILGKEISPSRNLADDLAEFQPGFR